MASATVAENQGDAVIEFIQNFLSCFFLERAVAWILQLKNTLLSRVMLQKRGSSKTRNVEGGPKTPTNESLKKIIYLQQKPFWKKSQTELHSQGWRLKSWR